MIDRLRCKPYTDKTFILVARTLLYINLNVSLCHNKTRGDEWNKQDFVDRMKLIDEMIIDQTPIADRFVSRYEKKFGLSKQ